MPEATERVTELEGALNEMSTKVDDLIQNQIEVKGANVNIPEDVLTEIKDLKKQGDDIQIVLAARKMGMEEKEFRARFDGVPGGGSAAVAAYAQQAGAAGNGFRPQLKTLGELFTGSDEFKHLRKSGRLTMDSPYELDMQGDVTALGTYDQKDVFTGMVSGINPNGFGQVQFDPMVPRAQRTARVRDLFPVATTNANLIDYFRVLGFVENNGDGNAGPVRERAAANGTSAPAGNSTDTFGLKNKSNLRFESAQAPVRTLAHWEAAHRNVLADEPQLQATINNELLYGLALEEDNQILNGDGTNENLLGILNTPNTQAYTQANASGSATEPKSDALRRAATKAIIANYAPTGYVLNPFDWEDIELQKDETGRYMLVTSISVGADSRVWRQPVVESPAMTEGTFVTGAWGIGAQLYDRQVANVRIAEQHADFFVRNAIAILVEERLAFAVKRPESFVIGTFFG